ncbi:MAG: carboxymuconolactone decarboxylase family protein [Alphaproteobacteria bacterium]|nr:carboxymuconolactone decarboxylase family protein [Alphaproteobacteria bacterium]
MSDTTSKNFTIHTADSASAEGNEELKKSKKKYGFIPNFIAVAAEAPSVVRSYDALTSEFEKTSLSATQRQVVFLAASTENGCDFCVPAHTAAVKSDASIDDGVAESLRNGEPLEDEKLEALASFTRSLLRNKGNVSNQEIESFLDADYTRQQALEVMVGLAAKTLSNFINNMADTPLNKELSEFAWTAKSQNTKAA